MISYAVIKRVENDFVVCSVEQIDILKSESRDCNKEQYTAYIPLEMFRGKNKTVSNNLEKVYSVVHNDNKVSEVLQLERFETMRRQWWMRIKPA